MYKLEIINDEIKIISAEGIGFIPEDNNNRHYQEYLAWIEAGNTPEVINDQY